MARFLRKINLTKTLLITFLLFLPVFSIMAVTIPDPLGGITFQQFLGKISDFIVILAIAIAPIIIIYAGIRFVFSAGDPGAVKNAQQILIWTFIGLLIVFSAKAIIDFINYIIKG